MLGKEFGNKVDFVYPSISILAQPAVTLVDKNVDKKGTRAVAEEYLKHLYSEEAQDIIGKHFYCPTSANDPYCPVRTAGVYARAWGSEFVRLQSAGHINIDAGFGPWPLGLVLLQSLLDGS